MPLSDQPETPTPHVSHPDSSSRPRRAPQVPAQRPALRHEHPRLFSRGSWREAQRIAAALRTETVGGALLLTAALAALVWANSPWREAYASLRDRHLAVPGIGLDLSLGHWAADGLLAIFFFVAGVELKHEFTEGDLSDRRRAAVPVAAACAGVALPALIFTGTALLHGGDAAVLRGWAIPTATDIAFALAVLAVIGTHLPSALRSFLLTLAVVDDLIAITIIAVAYTSSLQMVPLALALVPLGAFALATRRGWTSPWILIPLAVLTWGLVHGSGIHATVAGVLLGLVTPVDVGGRLEHVVRPVSAGFAVPLFAFFAAGVTVGGGGLGEAVRDPAAQGVVLALVLGKLLGIFGATWLLARFTRAELDSDITWSDLLGLSLLAGIGFTVSLLVGELAYGTGSPRDDHVKLAVLLGSLLSALLAGVVLRRRNRHYREVEARESSDEDQDGVPDVYQTDGSHLVTPRPTGPAA
ncbi:Na+/H+ antiporter NhaA [Arsenicicoccus dermatophilus]|uniref:Na+/H+ antiporter NhaA n=1 Tax=Arsenicicoccus dermatophilus TaxID=1076331 RepID=UPI001F4C62AF|nr:Na+/H+ antiporter NhaA [Arsenicicoccus dermatophilus]MCH8611719.1 Na+/H+ antiporter NhaA [Arsenicicoccus dermatophilus]